MSESILDVRAAAADPSTPTKVVGQIASDQEDSPARRLARRNPSLPGDIHLRLMQQGDPDAWASELVPLTLCMASPDEMQKAAVTCGIELLGKDRSDIPPERLSNAASMVRDLWYKDGAPTDLCEILGRIARQSGQGSKDHRRSVLVSCLCSRTVSHFVSRAHRGIVEDELLSQIEEWAWERADPDLDALRTRAWSIYSNEYEVARKEAQEAFDAMKKAAEARLEALARGAQKCPSSPAVASTHAASARAKFEADMASIDHGRAAAKAAHSVAWCAYAADDESLLYVAESSRSAMEAARQKVEAAHAADRAVHAAAVASDATHVSVCHQAYRNSAMSSEEASAYAAKRHKEQATHASDMAVHAAAIAAQSTHEVQDRPKACAVFAEGAAMSAADAAAAMDSAVEGACFSHQEEAAVDAAAYATGAVAEADPEDAEEHLLQANRKSASHATSSASIAVSAAMDVERDTVYVALNAEMAQARADEANALVLAAICSTGATVASSDATDAREENAVLQSASSATEAMSSAPGNQPPQDWAENPSAIAAEIAVTCAAQAAYSASYDHRGNDTKDGFSYVKLSAVEAIESAGFSEDGAKNAQSDAEEAAVKKARDAAVHAFSASASSVTSAECRSWADTSVVYHALNAQTESEEAKGLAEAALLSAQSTLNAVDGTDASDVTSASWSAECAKDSLCAAHSAAFTSLATGTVMAPHAIKDAVEASTESMAAAERSAEAALSSAQSVLNTAAGTSGCDDRYARFPAECAMKAVGESAASMAAAAEHSALAASNAVHVSGEAPDVYAHAAAVNAQNAVEATAVTEDSRAAVAAVYAVSIVPRIADDPTHHGASVTFCSESVDLKNAAERAKSSALSMYNSMCSATAEDEMQPSWSADSAEDAQDRAERDFGEASPEALAMEHAGTKAAESVAVLTSPRLEQGAYLSCEEAVEAAANAAKKAAYAAYVCPVSTEYASRWEASLSCAKSAMASASDVKSASEAMLGALAATLSSNLKEIPSCSVISAKRAMSAHRVLTREEYVAQLRVMILLAVGDCPLFGGVP